MNLRSLFLFAALFLTSSALAQDEAQVTKLLKQLQSQDAGQRRDAMADLQTSLDPRIPDACLAALQTEGDSTRRLAARAIGSRWHQIPKERVPVFVAALKPHLESEHDGLINMARRGIALLNHDYSGAMVSRGKSKRWVVYERHGLPCLIDTENNTEELLGFSKEDFSSFTPSWGNDELTPFVFWHPKQDMVALDILTSRRSSTIWIWRHGKGLRQLNSMELAKVLGHKEDDIAWSAGFSTEIEGWKGAVLNFRLDYAVDQGGDFIQYNAVLRWDSATDQIAVLSNKKAE